MTFQVIDNPALQVTTGFTAAQFRKLDALYLRYMAEKIITYRTVECDFDAGLASYTYYKTPHQPASLQFIIRKIGPNAVHFEVFKMGKGCIAKSSLFERSYNKLLSELESLAETP